MEEDNLLEDEVDERPRRARRSRPCPKCGSADIRRSNYESLWVTINQALGRWPFRCRNCRNLFFLAGAPPPES